MLLFCFNSGHLTNSYLNISQYMPISFSEGVRLMSRVFSSNGFSMAELMVTMAVMTIVFVGTGAFFVHLNSNYSDVKTKTGVNT